MESRRLRRIAGLMVVGVAVLSLAGVAQVVINEIAWAGTAASANDEWIELYNPSDQAVDLTGWTLRIDGGVIQLGDVGESTIEVRWSVIEAGGYLVLERTDDTTISDIAADVLYKGGLSNGGEDIFLVDAAGETVDEALFAESGWPGGTAGDGDVPYRTLERILPAVNGVEWAGNAPMASMNGVDADGHPLCGTPGSVNGAAIFLASAPHVDYVGPTSDEVHGTVAIQWSATDPDGEDSALRVRVNLASEDGNSVVTLGENLANTGSVAWDTTEYDNGVYRIEIWVEDAEGYTNSASSDVLEIKNEA